MSNNSPPYLTDTEYVIYNALLKQGIKLLKRAQQFCVQVVVPPNFSNKFKIKAAAYALVKAGYNPKRKVKMIKK